MFNGKIHYNYGKIHHAINGKTHYFDWAMFKSYVKLPEGSPLMDVQMTKPWKTWIRWILRWFEFSERWMVMTGEYWWCGNSEGQLTPKSEGTVFGILCKDLIPDLQYKEYQWDTLQ